MKITDPQIIRDGEKDLIDSVQADLDPEVVRQILKKRMSLAALAAKGGQIVVHNNEVAFRLDFEVNLSGSLLFDRQGNFIDDSLETDIIDTAPDEQNFQNDPDDEIDAGLAFGDSPDELSGFDPEDRPDETSPAPDSDLDHELELAAEELSLEDLEEDEDAAFLDDDESAFERMMDEDAPFGEEEGTQGLDDDINDILKESREFWEQKKDS